MKIDIENHYYTDDIMLAMEQRTEPPFFDREADIIQWTDYVKMPQAAFLPHLLETGEKRIELLKKAGIDKAVLGCSPGVEQLDVEESIRVCRLANDAVAALIKKYPDFYIGSAILPVKDVDAACEELERCVKELGFVSWQTHSNYGDSYPDEEKYRPIFKKAAELGVYVYFHPQLSTLERLEGFGFPLPGSGLGFTLDAIISVTRMILSGMFDEIPNLQLVLGHLGEGFPFYLKRMDNRMRVIYHPNVKCKEDVSYYFKHNIWVSTSGNMSKEAFACAKEVVGMDRILFATDYPYEELDDMMEFLDDLPLTVGERDMLFYKNAEVLMNKSFK